MKNQTVRSKLSWNAVLGLCAVLLLPAGIADAAGSLEPQALRSSVQAAAKKSGKKKRAKLAPAAEAEAAPSTPVEAATVAATAPSPAPVPAAVTPSSTPAPGLTPVPATVRPEEPAARASSSKATALRVAVMDPAVDGEVPPRALAAFNALLAPEVRKLEGVSAIGMADIREMINFDRQRQLMGCNDETCMEEIGFALGVDEIVTARLTALGNSYGLSMKRMNMRKAKVVQSVSRHFAKADGEELLAVVGPIVGELFPDRALREGKVRGVSKEVARKVNPPPLPRWVFITTATAATLVAAGGVGAGLLARDSQSQYDALAESSLTTPIEGSRLVSLADQGQQRATIANGLFIGAGALALGAAIEAFFTDWNNDRAALSVGATAGPSSGGLQVSGSF